MGADYIDAILNGYTNQNDPQWNLYYPGHKIAMPQPITDGAVKYTDGTAPTLPNYSKDIAAFLSWAAEPNLVERKKIGLRVMLFLFVLAALLYFTKRGCGRQPTDRAVLSRLASPPPRLAPEGFFSRPDPATRRPA